MDRLSDAIHHNRDESSFTARLFEGLLFPMWRSSPRRFGDFLAMLAAGSSENLELLRARDPSTWVGEYRPTGELRFVDGMLFVENLDLFAYCTTRELEVSIGGGPVDQTAFDCVIAAEDPTTGDQIALVFEVRCFTDLKYDVVVRQRSWLSKYRGRLFAEFVHFSLISQENLERGEVFFAADGARPGSSLSSIVTWRQMCDFLGSRNTRFHPDVEFSCLHKRVSLRGAVATPRTLVGNGRKPPRR